MSFARWRLILAAVLFLGWLSWLAMAVREKGTVQIVSRAQLAAASSWFILDVSVGDDGIPKPIATVLETIFGEAVTGAVEIRNLPAAATPLPVAAGSRTPPAGTYLVPAVKIAEGVYRIAGLPRSPSLEAQTPERGVIYPWTEDVKLQIQNLK